MKAVPGAWEGPRSNPNRSSMILETDGFVWVGAGAAASRPKISPEDTAAGATEEVPGGGVNYRYTSISKYNKMEATLPTQTRMFYFEEKQGGNLNRARKRRNAKTIVNLNRPLMPVSRSVSASATDGMCSSSKRLTSPRSNVL